MKHKMAALCLFLLLTRLPMALADGYVTFTVTNVTYSEGNSYASVSYDLTQGNPNPDGCQSSTYFLVAYTSSLPARESAMQAAILTAEVSGRPVQGYLSGCASALSGTTYPVVYYLTE